VLTTVRWPGRRQSGCTNDRPWSVAGGRSTDFTLQIYESLVRAGRDTRRPSMHGAVPPLAAADLMKHLLGRSRHAGRATVQAVVRHTDTDHSADILIP